MRVWILAVAFAGAATAAMAEDRAVVVEQRSYPAWPAVGGVPVDVAAQLEAAGLRVARGVDLGAAAIREALADLERPDDVPGARIVVLQGEFVHAAGETWLLGTDAKAPTLARVDESGVALSRVLALLKPAGSRAVVLLSDGPASVTGTGLSDGIGAIASPNGAQVIAGPTLGVAAAAAALARPGTTVADALAADPGLKRLAGAEDAAAPLAAGAKVLEGESEAWILAAARGTRAEFEAFLKAFPSGKYAPVARARLDALAAPPLRP